MTPFEILTTVVIFFSAIILHEYAHGWVAYRLGDTTAKLAGRLTLNPFKHVDPVGTLLLPAILFITKSPVLFGWAKPVPVNFLKLRHPKQGIIWVGLAGPAINVILAVCFSLLLSLDLSASSRQFAELGVMVNLILAVFNMIPIPPLDGSRLVMGLLPSKYAYLYSRLEPYGIIIVFLLLYTGVINQIVWPVVETLAHFLGVS